MTQRHKEKGKGNTGRANNPGQPEPLKGSKKVKKANHVSQTNGEG
ncbi:small acid-soluble spore protein P [Alkalicoccobacillus porphyridii]|uniref:Small acid-soluble spore protein P n=1 Tax=Alkalicoccobacillus porphyridii TaxID=2597270 RepID=A0A553ZUQ2_9BACI|nr:small acid-soluble spore protein P [Alkalicoccobacillus porphyridii]TSB45162.1 small acid-soluble spore protein P [Alkalicoccobacillus porphyridii]